MEKQQNAASFEARLAALRERKKKERRYFEMLLDEIGKDAEKEKQNGNSEG